MTHVAKSNSGTALKRGDSLNAGPEVSLLEHNNAIDSYFLPNPINLTYNKTLTLAKRHSFKTSIVV